MNFLNKAEQKILTPENLKQTLAYWNFKDFQLVFTNGCFDILHRGHIDYLAKAKALGDILIIGLNTDDSVSRLKGPNRPVNSQEARAMVLASLCFVDAIIYFDEDTPYSLIQHIQPDILVKGSDYKPENIVGADIVKAKGGRIETIDFLHGFSTSGIIEKIKK
jgi:rfaE bifunctional protein nucleotidyltransferase chain/domain